jgi:mannose-6-phosphate isomerase-like protein (cupin superfamily)
MEINDMQLHQGLGFSAAHGANFDSLSSHHFTHPLLGRPVPGKLFLHQPLAMTGAEVSLNRLPPGAAMPFLHKHRLNEEIYFFIAGDGEFQVNGALFPVGPGSVVRVEPAAARGWRSVGAEPLDYIVLQVPHHGFQGRGEIDDGEVVPQPPAWKAAVKPVTAR